MSDAKLSVGEAIDRIAEALESFDAHQQNTILSTVCALLKIPLPGSAVGGPASSTPPKVSKHSEVSHRSPTASHGVEPGIDIKSLKEQKQPRSAREMACLVGYYLTELAPESERKSAIAAADIDKYFKQAGYRSPGALVQVLPDAKKGGYFDSEARGEYKLNRVGYNAVVHSMPKREKS